MNTIIGVGGVLLQAGSILVVREDTTDPSTGKERGQISIPMGHVEPGESPEEAIVREFREETGHVVRPIRLLGVFHISGKNASGSVFLMELVPGQTPPVSDNGSLLHPQWVSARFLLSAKGVRPPTKEIVQAALETLPAIASRPP